MNFGTILQSVTNECAKMAVANNDIEAKTKAKTFINMVNIKEVLRRQYKIYTQLEASCMKDRGMAERFVTESINALDGFYFGDIAGYNDLVEMKCSIPRIRSNQLNMDIGTLIKHKTDPGSVDPKKYVESFNRVVEHVQSERRVDDPIETLNEMVANSTLKYLKPKHVVKLALNRFNKKHTSLDSEDRKVFWTLKEGNKKKIATLHTSMVEESKSILDDLKKTMDADLIDKGHKAIEECASSTNNETVLDTYELMCELRSLNNGE